MFDDRKYIILPIEKASIYLKCDYQSGRLSNDQKFLVWSDCFDFETLENLTSDLDVKFFTYSEISFEMNSDLWQVPYTSAD
jgi:hypothetical protein